MDIVTGTGDRHEPGVLETRAQGPRGRNGNGGVEGAVHLEHRDRNVLVRPVEQAVSVDGVLTPDKGQQRRAGATNPIRRLHSLAMLSREGVPEDPGPRQQQLPDPWEQWQHLRQVHGQAVADEHPPRKRSG